MHTHTHAVDVVVVDSGLDRMKRKEASPRGRSALPRSLQALAVLILVVAVLNVGSVHWFFPVNPLTTMQASVSRIMMTDSPSSDRGVSYSLPTTRQPRQSRERADGLPPPPSPVPPQTNLSGNHHTNATATTMDPHVRTLALAYPPGLMGGYRNEVIRFIGFCLHAWRQNYQQIYLPSLLWSTQVRSSLSNNGDNDNDRIPWHPVPMEWLFDIDYWNAIAPTEGLPKIVTGTFPDADCWKPHLFDTLDTSDWGPLPRAAFLQSSGSLVNVTEESWRMISDPDFLPRRVDVWPRLKHCERPYVYGGGTAGGRLWYDITFLREANESVPQGLDRAVLRALQPLPQWKALAESCLDVDDNSKPEAYVALHSRIELDMLQHPCGITMERNLTEIFRQVGDLVDRQPADRRLTQLFVAVSRSDMTFREGQDGRLFRATNDYNLQVLNRYSSRNHQEDRPRNLPDMPKVAGKLSVVECGKGLVDDYYRQHPEVPDHGSLLQAVVNFHLAVHATIFVGVKGSSYSTDVLTTRYHLGRGADNYLYTKRGAVQQVGNGGLPPPHGNCMPRMDKPNGGGGGMRNGGGGMMMRPPPMEQRMIGRPPL